MLCRKIKFYQLFVSEIKTEEKLLKTNNKKTQLIFLKVVRISKEIIMYISGRILKISSCNYVLQFLVLTSKLIFFSQSHSISLKTP